MERWLPVVGFEARYEVSDLGRVRSLRFRGHSEARVMKTSSNYAGYQVVTLGSDRKQYRVHCLVLEAFVGPRPPGMQGCHNDGDKANNALPNLRWDTPQANVAERVHAAGERNGRAKLTDVQVAYIVRARELGTTCKVLAAKYGVSIARIAQISRKAA